MKIKDRFIKIIVAETTEEVIDIWFDILVTRDDSLIQAFFRSTLGGMARDRVTMCVKSAEGRVYFNKLATELKEQP